MISVHESNSYSTPAGPPPVPADRADPAHIFNHHRGVALGVNIKVHNDYSGSEQTVVTGLNIQAVGGSAPMQHGIQVHDGNNHFQTAINLPGKGAAGIALPGSFQVGLNLRDKHLRLNENACVELDGKGQNWLSSPR
jgi:hypothetical protein